jgi:alkyl hydroperoxide reductase subunit AhpC
MALQIGDTAPDFGAQTTEGSIHFHDWIGDSWAREIYPEGWDAPRTYIRIAPQPS